MDEKIKHALKVAKVKEMKYPTIVMNDKDLETFTKQLKLLVPNSEFGDNPTYEGIPIFGRKQIEKGKFIVYDRIPDQMKKWEL